MAEAKGGMCPLLEFVVAAFFVLHGLVHLLYVGHSWRLFELQPGKTWPEGSWALSALVGGGVTRWVASVTYILAGIAFAVGGVGLLAKQSWWCPVVVRAAAFSGAMVILFWDGRLGRLDEQGGMALLINVAILVAVVMLRWPDFWF